MEKQDCKEKAVKEEKQTGENLLSEYYSQSKDDKHNMGYSVYAQTHSDGCC